jgi:quinol monooxygenase YgiN
MSADAVISFHTFTPTTETWSAALDPLTQNPNVKAVYWGQALEDPEKYVVATHWSSSEALEAFASSDALAGLAGVATGGSVITAHVSLEGSPEKALDVPCTEVLTAYGVEPAFIGQCRDFIVKLDAGKLAGYHGYGLGEVHQDIAKDSAGEKGPAVILIIGWDSKEAHLEAKAKPGRKFMIMQCPVTWRSEH